MGRWSTPPAPESSRGAKPGHPDVHRRVRRRAAAARGSDRAAVAACRAQADGSARGKVALPSLDLTGYEVVICPSQAIARLGGDRRAGRRTLPLPARAPPLGHHEVRRDRMGEHTRSSSAGITASSRRSWAALPPTASAVRRAGPRRSRAGSRPRRGALVADARPDSGAPHRPVRPRE